MHDQPMRGQVALVAGASKGIGAAAARAYAAAGAAVVLAARDARALAEVAGQIVADGGRAIAVRADVTDAGSVSALVDRAMAEYGRLDAAFNNAAGGPRPAPLADIDPSEFDAGIAVHVRGTFLGMKFQIPAMLASGGGSIVNMASVAGLTGTANLAAYVAGKAGIIGLTRVAALDYAHQGIRVNVLAPGPILTHHLAAAGPQAQRLAAQATPMGRTGSAEEVAQAVLWLSSDRSSYVTGAVIPLDGGMTAGNKPPQMYRQGEPMRVARVPDANAGLAGLSGARRHEATAWRPNGPRGRPVGLGVVRARPPAVAARHATVMRLRYNDHRYITSAWVTGTRCRSRPS